MIALRSFVFNVVFYLNVAFFALLTIPFFLLPRRFMLSFAMTWARASLFWLRLICGIRFEVRGAEKIGQGVLKGPLIVAAKHQSAWETFALMVLFEQPIYILKRELQWLPLFGWAALKAGMISVDRAKGASALIAMARRARDEIHAGRQLIIFPEGTRRPPGAPPDYKSGIALLYKESNVVCLPLALNSGLFWPRRTFLRYPGTIVVECCDPIAPGLAKGAFMAALQGAIEPVAERLRLEGVRELQARGVEVALAAPDQLPPRKA